MFSGNQSRASSTPRRRRTFGLLALAAPMLLCFTGQANGAVITGVTAFSPDPVFGGRTADRTVDGSGLSAEPVDISVPGVTHDREDNSHWLVDASANNVSFVATVYITFDLGAVYDVAYMRIWNWNDGGFFNHPRGVGEFKIAHSTVAPPANDTGTSYALSPFGASPELTGELLDFSAAPLTARYITLSVDSKLGDLQLGPPFNFPPNFGGSYVGLAEVRFQSAVIPEPASLGALAVGLLLCGRRRS